MVSAVILCSVLVEKVGQVLQCLWSVCSESGLSILVAVVCPYSEGGSSLFVAVVLSLFRKWLKSFSACGLVSVQQVSRVFHCPWSCLCSESGPSLLVPVVLSLFSKWAKSLSACGLSLVRK